MDTLPSSSTVKPQISSKDQGEPSPKEWHEFAVTLGWYPVVMTAKSAKTFEIPGGEKVTVTPGMARSIMAAVHK